MKAPDPDRFLLKRSRLAEQYRLGFRDGMISILLLVFCGFTVFLLIKSMPLHH